MKFFWQSETCSAGKLPLVNPEGGHHQTCSSVRPQLKPKIVTNNLIFFFLRENWLSDEKGKDGRNRGKDVQRNREVQHATVRILWDRWALS